MNIATRAANIHKRLLERAREDREDFNLVVGRYAIERLLYRLSISEAQHQFVLKGALLFNLWFNVPHRPTRDADFLGLGSEDAAALSAIIQEICEIPADDGMTYESTTVTVRNIREEASYGGLRVTLQGSLGRVISRVQLDVGYGDAVTPRPKAVSLPLLLEGLPAPILQVYPRETVVAENLEAIASLGMINSRMKDYFDLLALLREGAMETATLAHAIAATFHRRGTRVPDKTPIGLTAEFACDPLKMNQWDAFLKRNRLTAPALEVVIEELTGLLREAYSLSHEAFAGLEAKKKRTDPRSSSAQ